MYEKGIRKFGSRREVEKPPAPVALADCLFLKIAVKTENEKAGEFSMGRVAGFALATQKRSRESRRSPHWVSRGSRRTTPRTSSKRRGRFGAVIYFSCPERFWLIVSALFETSSSIPRHILQMQRFFLSPSSWVVIPAKDTLGATNPQPLSLRRLRRAK